MSFIFYAVGLIIFGHFTDYFGWFHLFLIEPHEKLSSLKTKRPIWYVSFELAGASAFHSILMLFCVRHILLGQNNNMRSEFKISSAHCTITTRKAPSNESIVPLQTPRNRHSQNAKWNTWKTQKDRKYKNLNLKRQFNPKAWTTQR